MVNFSFSFWCYHYGYGYLMLVDMFLIGRETYKELCHMNCERYSPVRRGSEGTCPSSPRLVKMQVCYLTYPLLQAYEVKMVKKVILMNIQQRDDRRHSAASSSPSSPVRLFQPLDSPLLPQHPGSPLPPDISQGLQGLHLYGAGPPSPFALANNQQLAMIQEHSVLKQIDPTVLLLTTTIKDAHAYPVKIM